MSEPSILTTTVGSYPVPQWLSALPSEQAVIDATRVIFDTQRSSGIDLPTDGELYRFDVNHPDTNGMIEYFLKPMGGCDSAIGRTDRRPAGPAPDRIEINVPRIGYYPRVPNPLGEGTYPGTLAVPTPAYRVRSVLRVI